MFTAVFNSVVVDTLKHGSVGFNPIKIYQHAKFLILATLGWETSLGKKSPRECP